jgi:hypothetical protein
LSDVHLKKHEHTRFLGFGCTDTTVMQILYFTRYSSISSERDCAPRRGVTWHHARPLLGGLEYEKDCAGIRLYTVAGLDSVGARRLTACSESNSKLKMEVRGRRFAIFLQIEYYCEKTFNSRPALN